MDTIVEDGPLSISAFEIPSAFHVGKRNLKTWTNNDDASSTLNKQQEDKQLKRTVRPLACPVFVEDNI